MSLERRARLVRLAALLLVTFGLGLAAGSWHGRAVPEMANDRPAATAPGPAEPDPPVDWPFPGVLVAAENPWGPEAPSEIPDIVRRQLRERGYDVEQREEFLPVPADDGTVRLLPVRGVRVHFVGNPPS